MLRNSDIINNALAFAVAAHGSQKRKYTGVSYLEHLKNVAEIVNDWTQDDEVVAAALLHDVLEDTDKTFLDIKVYFGERVANLVLELTDVYTKSAFPNLNRTERKAREAARLGHVSPEAKMIKIADLADNTASIVKHDPKFAETYLVEKAEVLRAMRVGNV